MYSTPTSKGFCKICKSPLKGRSDKIFCSNHCKNYYHLRLRKATDLVVADINAILHRNRCILLEILGKNKSQKKIPRLALEKKKFRFKYHTHSYLNSKGKYYYFLYDLAWMEFTDQEILIIRKDSTHPSKPKKPV